MGHYQIFFIGCPEAEGENQNSPVNILDVFEDYLDTMTALNNGKFIITGRKGAGKSAIAEYVQGRADNESTVFCSRLNMSDFKIHELLQSHCLSNIDEGFIIEWVLYTNFAKLLVQNQKLLSDHYLKNLERFLKRNTGYVEISESAIQELIEKKEWNLQVGNLLDIANKLGIGNAKEFRKRRPYYYELLPILRDTIKQLIHNIDIQNDMSEYIIFIDDLDVGVHADDKASLDIVYELVRKARDFNKTFSRNFCVILLLRSHTCPNNFQNGVIF